MAMRSAIISRLASFRSLMESSTSRSSLRFLSDQGRVLREEERAAENVYIKKMEREKLEKQKLKEQKEKAEKEKAEKKIAEQESGKYETAVHAADCCNVNRILPICQYWEPIVCHLEESRERWGTSSTWMHRDSRSSLHYKRLQRLRDNQVGKHGIIIEFTDPDYNTKRSATYLPAVAAHEGWTKIEAIDSLMRKAGYNGTITESVWKRIQLTRYQSTLYTMHYGDFVSYVKTTRGVATSVAGLKSR